jgi:uncharacterized protein YfaQ (DUF2300 family)
VVEEDEGAAAAEGALADGVEGEEGEEPHGGADAAEAAAAAADRTPADANAIEHSRNARRTEKKEKRRLRLEAEAAAAAAAVASGLEAPVRRVCLCAALASLLRHASAMRVRVCNARTYEQAAATTRGSAVKQRELDCACCGVVLQPRRLTSPTRVLCLRRS